MNNFKVVVIGTTNVGKTSILNRISDGSFSEDMQVTTNTSVITKDCELDIFTFTINYWDTAGQEKYKSVSEIFYQGAKYAIAVFRIDDPSSFTEMVEYIKTFRDKGESVPGPDGNALPNIIAVANMTDLVTDSSELVVKYQHKLMNDNEDYGVSCLLPTSAKNNTGIDDLHAEIQRLIVHDYLEPTESVKNQKDEVDTGIVISEPRQSNDGKSCC